LAEKPLACIPMHPALHRYIKMHYGLS